MHFDFWSSVVSYVIVAFNFIIQEELSIFVLDFINIVKAGN